MNATKITNKDISDMLISALPTRPTAPLAFGGRGYSASDMKAAFDRLPRFIIERYNLLIDDILDPDGLMATLPTGISDTHTLKELISDILSGAFADYLAVLGEPLSDTVLYLKNAIASLSTADKDSAEVIEDLKAWLDDADKSLAEVAESSESTRKLVSELEELVKKSSIGSDEMDIDLGGPEDLLEVEE